jgi:23S rRNA pseudouridine2604 synthase
VTIIAPKTLRFVLKEGRNRQIRKMCEALSYDVERLHRTRVAELQLGDLEVGGLRPLDANELRVVSDRVRARARASARSTEKQSSESRRRRAALDANPSGWGSKIYKDSRAT